MALLAGCAVLKAPAPAVTPAEPPADRQASPAPPAIPPAAPVNPLLTDAAQELATRSQRLAALSGSEGALPAAEQGYYLDVLYAELIRIMGADADVSRSDGAIRVVLPREVSFDVASATLSAEAEAVLAPIIAPLRNYASLLISVHGHTDSTGPAPVNRRLSAQRALAVAQRLQALGVPARRVLAVGHGADNPRGDNADEAGRQANRRVEILLEVIGRPDAP